MASSRIAIAQTVASVLQDASDAGTTFSQPFKTAVKYVPSVDLEALSQMTVPLVTVVPMGGEKHSPYTRQVSRKDFSVEIGVQKKLAPTTDAESSDDQPELDAMMFLCEQIAAFLEPLGGNPIRLGTTGASFMGVIEINPPYIWEHLIGDRVFTSRIVVTLAYT